MVFLTQPSAHKLADGAFPVAPASYHTIRTYAETFPHPAVEPVGRQVNSFGGQVIRTQAPYGFVTVRTPTFFTIHLPYFITARRERFLTAHFFAHTLIHLAGLPAHDTAAVELPCGVFRCSVNPAVETQANIFVSNLLMPEQEFTAAASEPEANMWTLSTRFGVSPLAATKRAETLNLKLETIPTTKTSVLHLTTEQP